MKSALFVDFDNVYSGLRRLDPAVAERFAARPIAWIHWLTETLAAPPYTPDGAQRRLLVRRCYLNPQVYQRFRPAFNRAGFEIIDCPPMTSEGKTSTDIHMVLDIVDLLQHEVHYDEFIVFSADADFTPVLRKLRRWDRRTTVLAVGFPSAAYQASADLLIDQDDFVRSGLGFGEPDPPPVAPAAVAAVRPSTDVIADVKVLIERQVADSAKAVSLPRLAGKALAEVDGLDAANWAGFGGFRRLVDSLHLAPLMVDWEAGAVLDPTRHARSAGPTEAPVKEAQIGVMQDDVTRLIQKEVEHAGRPVACGRLAQLIVDRHSALAADWGGKGSFRKFLEALDLGRLKVTWENGAGKVLDPQAPAMPLDEPPSIRTADWGEHVHLLPVIQQIHTATGIPVLSPQVMQGLLSALVTEVTDQPFALSDTGKRVRDRCREAGLGVNRADVSYVLKGIVLGGHAFGTGNDTIATLGSRLVDSVRAICSREQVEIDEPMEMALREWVCPRPADKVQKAEGPPGSPRSPASVG
ncbi:MAG: NYN domain-containing protein [Rhodoferax sp.]|nr:NYN domain-containing protein [Rhodoferax sp.]